MKISIITPFNKGVHFLKDYFMSLEAQTYQDFEIVLALNGIEDDERAEIDALIKEKEDHFQIQVIETDNDVAIARNEAIKAARGEYLFFMDADDYIEEEALECLYDELKGTKYLDFTFALWKVSYNRYEVYMGVERKPKNEDDENNDADQVEDDSDDTDDVVEVVQGKYSSYTPGMNAGVEKTAAKRHYKLYKDYQRALDIDELDDEAAKAQQYQVGAAQQLLLRQGGLKTISALSILIRKGYLTRHKIDFDSESYLYEDLSFMVKLIDSGAVGKRVNEAKYVKHRHNDPVTHPGINQMKDPKRFEYSITAYNRAKDAIDEDGVARFYLDQIMLNYFCRYFVTRVRRSTNDYWREERFEVMQEIVKGCTKEIKDAYGPFESKLIKACEKGDLKAVQRLTARKLAKKKFKSMKTNSHTFPRYLYYNFFTEKPLLENVVMFETFFGKSYSDSPKYIYEYLHEHYPRRFKYVWSVDDMSVKVPYGAKKVKRYSIEYMYYLARAKYQVFNVRQPLGYRKQKGNVFLECWHGTPLKRLVFDQEEVASADPKYKSHFYKHTLDWDYLISPNPFSTGAFQSAFRVPKEKIIETGYPRNDILYKGNTPENIKNIKKKLGIPEDKKVILYAPTWRDDDYVSSGNYNFELQLNLDDMRKRLSDEYVVVLRMHYYIASQMDISEYEGFAFDESSYSDISDLYLISDILITDYSSVFFDYGNLRRPVLFFTYDLEKYRDMLRGFYLDIEKDVPGPLLYTADEVTDAIERIDEITEQYKDRYDEFYERFCSVDDGNAAKRVCEIVFGKEEK
ncbi:MAG: bifunctional glycosyltransferase family 2 protein/CDP-glycerol:glycerophosphate glycerophosphotransferase [Lachnospiraceae bacterium]|nr:bifunctional glycosyltransferase family 2 protein/CDP-glycerol:glycerophosphate glycerophosphotransferase [Lachnospiraceae bacterium]